MRLTDIHYAIINDRPIECIIECLTDSNPNLNEELIETTAMKLLKRLHKSRWLDYASLNALEQEIIADCINGSTYAACLLDVDGTILEKTYHLICKSGDELAIECNTTFPHR